jgi:hypothetical protein
MSKKPIADNILKYIGEIKEIRFIDRARRIEEETVKESVKEEVEEKRV